MKYVVLLLLLLISQPVRGENTLYIGLKSNHSTSCFECKDRKWNETHNLIGIGTKKHFFGYMRNSWDKDSFFAGRRWYTDWTPHIRPYVNLGLATGYHNGDGVEFGPLDLTGFIGIEVHPKSRDFGVVFATVPGKVIAVGLKLGM